MSLSAACLFGADPLAGTWKLELSESRFNPGPAPVSQTRTYRPTAEGLEVTVATTTSDHKVTQVEFPAIYDGKVYPVKGPGPIDALQLEKVNNFQSRATLKHAGKVIATAERTISEDGKVLTIAYKETEGDSPADNVLVYRKTGR